MDLAESGIRVEATSDNRAGLVRFDSSNMPSDASSFYVIMLSFDTHYNESSVSALTSSQAQLSNPVHRYYQGAGQPAGFSGHHSLHFSREAKSYGIIQGYSEVTRAADGQSLAATSDERGPVALFFEFPRGSEVVLAAGSSFVSRDKAEANLRAELGQQEGGMFDVEAVVARVTQRWETSLSAVLVSDDPQVTCEDMTCTMSCCLTPTSSFLCGFVAIFDELMLDCSALTTTPK